MWSYIDLIDLDDALYNWKSVSPEPCSMEGIQNNLPPTLRQIPATSFLVPGPNHSLCSCDGDVCLPAITIAVVSNHLCVG